MPQGFSLVQQNRETEKGQKLAMPEALLISKARYDHVLGLLSPSQERARPHGVCVPARKVHQRLWIRTNTQAWLFLPLFGNFVLVMDKSFLWLQRTCEHF